MSDGIFGLCVALEGQVIMLFLGGVPRDDCFPEEMLSFNGVIRAVRRRPLRKHRV